MLSQTPATTPSGAVESPSAPPATQPARTPPFSVAQIAEPVRTGRGGGWLWLLLIAAGGTAGWHYWPQIVPHLEPLLPKAAEPKAKAGPRVTPVVAAAVRQRDMQLYLNGLGTVTALKTVTIRSRVEGELTNVAFVEGQMVQEGDLLAEIDPRPYQVQRDQAEAQLRRNEALLRAARQTLERYLQLREQLIATAQQVDDQKALVDQMEAAIKADQALIATADLQLNYCRIVAPISGRIGLRMVDKGNIVRPGDPNGLAVITQLQPIALVFNVPQDEVSRVLKAKATGAELQVDAFDRDFRNHLATGKLLAIDNQVDPTNGTVRLKAEFPNDDGLLFPNQFVNARLLVETHRAVTVAPAAAVQRGPNGTFVYVVQPDETVEVRLIAVGQTEGGDTAVHSGLEPGELVVTDGLDKLAPGAKVALRDSKTSEAVAGSAASPSPGQQEGESTARPSEVGSQKPATPDRG